MLRRVATLLLFLAITAASTTAQQTPADKLAELQKARELEEATGDPREENVSISGTIRTDDGSPLPPDLRIYGHATTRNYGASFPVDVDGDRFSAKTFAGQIGVYAHAPGFAPAVTRPARVAPNGKLENLELVLRKGFTAEVLMVDEELKPITGAKVESSYKPGGFLPKQATVTSDEDGMIALPHSLEETPVSLQVRFPGFESEDGKVLTLKPGEPVTWTLRRAKVTRAVVRSAAGEPVADAQVHRIYNNDPRTVPDLLTTTDADGRFAIDTLRADAEHWLMVIAPGHALQILPAVRAGDEKLDVRLGRPLFVEGTIAGVDRIRADHTGRRRLTYHNSIEIARNSTYGTMLYADMVERDGVGHFRLDNLLPGEVTLDLPEGRSREFKVTDKPVEGVRIDLRAPAAQNGAAPEAVMRPVVVKLQVPAGAPPAKGKLQVNRSGPATATRRWMEPLNVEVSDNQARFDAPVGGQFSYESDGLLGYWIPRKWGVAVEAGEQPMVLEVPAHPSGAAFGKVTAADGKPPASYSVSLVVVEGPPQIKTGNGSTEQFSSPQPWNSNDGDEKYLISPVAVGGKYQLVASDHDSHGYAVSDVFDVTTDNPIREIDLQFKPGRPLTVQVAGPDGNAVAGVAVGLSYDSGRSHTFSKQGKQVDADGRITLPGVVPGLPGKYQLQVKPLADYRPVTVDVLEFGERPLEVKLETGLVLSGLVIEAKTGRPIPHVQVMAMPANPQQMNYNDWPKTTTDGQGRFRFTTLDQTEYRV